MDVDTDAVRAVGLAVERLALDWLATPALDEPVPDDPAAAGPSPAGTELAVGMATLARRSQRALTDLVVRLHRAGETLTDAAAGFERAESAVATTVR